MTGALQGGTRLGPYTILGPLGKGGMGVVYKAQDERLGRLVAIKLLSRDLLADSQFMARFAREARAAAAFVHPNVTRLFFVGEEGGVPFVVLEYLPGGSLKDLLKRKGALPPRRAASLGAQIARGLEAIHQMGLVHRDVKPENVLLDEEGHAKLSDFGLVGRSVEARVDATRALTKVGEMLGTLEYISPEQLEDSSQVDGRADLYGLGGLLYALLAGRPPFDGTGYVLVKKHLADRPRPPGELVGGIPPRLEGLVLRLLEKHPAARPASAALVAQELEAISRELEREKPRRRPLVVAGAALGAAGLALGALLLARAETWSVSTNASTAPAATGNARARPATAANAKPAPASTLAKTPDLPVETSSFRLSRSGHMRLAAVWGSYAWKHARDVNAVAVSSDGSKVLSASDDGTVAVWDASTGAELGRFRGHAGPVRTLLLHGGDRAFSGGDDGVPRLWEVATGKEVLHRDAPPGSPPIVAIASSKDGRFMLSANAAGDVAVFDRRSGTPRAFSDRRGKIVSAGFENDSITAFTVIDGGMPAYFNCETGQEAAPDDSGDFRWVRLSPRGGHAFAELKDGRLEIAEIASGGVRALRQFEGDASGLVSTDFSPDGRRVLTGHDDGRIQLWEASTGAVRVLPGHRDAVRSVAFFPDGKKRAVSAGKDHTVRLWDLEAMREIGDCPGHRSEVWVVAHLPGGETAVTGSWDGTLRLLDVSSGRETRALALHDAGVQAFALSRDGTRAISGDRTGIVCVWDTKTWERVGHLRPHTAAVRALAFAADGTAVLSGGEDGLLVCWDLDREVRKVTPSRWKALSQGWVNAAVFSPDGRLCLADGQDALVLADAETGKESSRWLAHGGAKPHVECIAFLADGRHAITGGRDSSLLVSDLSKGSVVRRVFGHKDRIQGLAVTPDGKLALTASWDRTIRLWDLEDGRELDQVDLTASTDHAISLSLAPDGRSFLAGTARGAVLRFELSLPGRKDR